MAVALIVSVIASGVMPVVVVVVCSSVVLSVVGGVWFNLEVEGPVLKRLFCWHGCCSAVAVVEKCVVYDGGGVGVSPNCFPSMLFEELLDAVGIKGGTMGEAVVCHIGRVDPNCVLYQVIIRYLVVADVKAPG